MMNQYREIWCVVASQTQLKRRIAQCHVLLHTFGIKTCYSFLRKQGQLFFYGSSDAATSAPLLSFILDQPLLPYFFSSLLCFFLPMWTSKSHAPTSFSSLKSFLILLFFQINLSSFCLLQPYHSLPLTPFPLLTKIIIK